MTDLETGNGGNRAERLDDPVATEGVRLDEQAKLIPIGPRSENREDCVGMGV